MTHRLVLLVAIGLVASMTACSDSEPHADPTTMVAPATSVVSTTQVAQTATVAPASTVEDQAGPTRLEDIVYATFDGAELKLDLLVPAEPAGAPIVITDWEVWGNDLAEEGVIVAVFGDGDEEEEVNLCPDDIFTDHGACFRASGEDKACEIRAVRALAAELGSSDPSVVLTGFSAGGGVAVQAALFGATLEELWDEFAATGGPPRQVECEVTDGSTHVDAVIGMGAPVDLFVPVIDGKYGKAYQEELDPDVPEFLSNAIGASPGLKVRLILGTYDEFPMEFADEFAALLRAANYDVQVIPFNGGHELPPTELAIATVREVLGR